VERRLTLATRETAPPLGITQPGITASGDNQAPGG